MKKKNFNSKSYLMGSDITAACWHINISPDFKNYVLGKTLHWQNNSYATDSNYNMSNAFIKSTKKNDYFNLSIKDLATQLLK